MDSESLRVGRELRERMREDRLSQKQVAKECGVSQPRISRVLAGEFTDKSALAHALCQRFDVTPLHAHISEADRAFEAVTGSLRSIWDGTPVGAANLRALIEAVRSVRTSS